MATKSAAAPSQASHGSRASQGATHQEVQKREQLRTLLVNKFKNKYGNSPALVRVIEAEVTKFLTTDRLTEANLKKLDLRIAQEVDKKDRQSQILDDRKSQRSQSAFDKQSLGGRSQKSNGLSAAALQTLNRKQTAGALDTRSRTSQMSRRAVSNARKGDVVSMASSKRAPTEIFSEINENDEWTAIQKFNTLLYYEEQKNAIMRDAERKRLIREELENQVRMKKQRENDNEKEKKAYDDLAEEHARLLEQREREKQDNMKQKLMNDKMMRDQQLMDEKRRRKNEEKEQMHQEMEFINRLRQEMENEKQIQLEKRRQEKEYLQKMLEENEKNKKRHFDEKQREKRDDLRAQEEYSRMLEKQEHDRNREMKRREQRAQDFMNKMADTVLNKMEQKQRQEDDMIAKYESERERKLREMEERRAQKQREEQEKLRSFLNNQIEDKRKRENQEKANIDMQARMWQVDKQNYEEEERRLKEKIGKINKDNAQFLMQQMNTKQSKSAKMNTNEYALNRPLLREVNQKLKNFSHYEGVGSLKSGQN